MGQPCCVGTAWIAVWLCWFMIGFSATVVGCQNASSASSDGECSEWNPLLKVALGWSVVGGLVIISALVLLRPPFQSMCGKVNSFILLIGTFVNFAVLFIVVIALVINEGPVMYTALVVTAQFCILGWAVYAAVLMYCLPIVRSDQPAEPSNENVPTPEIMVWCPCKSVNFLLVVLVATYSIVGCVLIGVGCASLAADPFPSTDGVVGSGLCQPFLDARSAVGATGAVLAFVYAIAYLWSSVQWGTSIISLCQTDHICTHFIAIWGTFLAVICFVTAGALLAIQGQSLVSQAFVVSACVFAYMCGGWCAILHVCFGVHDIALSEADLPAPERSPPLPYQPPQVPNQLQSVVARYEPIADDQEGRDDSGAVRRPFARLLATLVPRDSPLIAGITGFVIPLSVVSMAVFFPQSQSLGRYCEIHLVLTGCAMMIVWIRFCVKRSYIPLVHLYSLFSVTLFFAFIVALWYGLMKAFLTVHAFAANPIATGALWTPCFVVFIVVCAVSLWDHLTRPPPAPVA